MLLRTSMKINAYPIKTRHSNEALKTDKGLKGITLKTKGSN